MNQRHGKLAFTLIELMISIALVVILMLGITKVFTLTSQTAGATNQMSSAMRDARSAQAIMYQDFSSAVRTDAPFMFFRSITQPAFRNKADRDSDRDFDPTASTVAQQNQILSIDLDGNNIEGEAAVPGERISPTTYNYRNHRLDVVSFFARHRFQRQTGGAASGTTVTAGPLVSPMNANEALIWYGHLWLPNNNNVWPTPAQFSPPIPSDTFPGQSDVSKNPNNYYATQWILGRVPILLAAPDLNGEIRDLTIGSGPLVSGTPQHFLVTDTNIADNLPMSPLQAGSYEWTKSTGYAPGTANAQLQESRYDLAGTTINAYRNQLYNLITKAPYIGPGAIPWWDHFMCYDVVQIPGGLTGGRFQASPFFSNPIDAQKTSRMAPVFLPACTQFMVEYAGDFLEQDTNPNSATYGQVTNAYWDIDPNTAPKTDGEIDFVVNKVTKTRSIRWYGLPRDVDGNGTILNDGNAADQLPDVLLLRDVIQSAASDDASAPIPASLSSKIKSIKADAAVPQGVSAPFERTLLAKGFADYASSNGFNSTNFSYTCAWGPTDRKPKMIRIIMTLDDPGAKTADGLTYQYVFTLP